MIFGCFVHCRYSILVSYAAAVDTKLLDGRQTVQESTDTQNLGVNDLLTRDNTYIPEFGIEIRQRGYLCPTQKSYLVSLKYDFTTLQSHNWIHKTVQEPVLNAVPRYALPRGSMATNIFKLFAVAKWFVWLDSSTANLTVVYPHFTDIISELITLRAACKEVQALYFHGNFDFLMCIRTFQYHFDHNIWSYYTLHLLLDIVDIGKREIMLPKGSSRFCEKSPFMCSDKAYQYVPDIYRIFMNITLQYKNIRFYRGVQENSIAFEKEIGYVLDEINSYIPRFVTRTETITKREKRSIIAALFTIGSGLFSTWRFYKDYTFKRNLKRTLKYILDNNEQFRSGILSNRRNLLSLADVTGSNFRELRTKFAELRNLTDRNYRSLRGSIMNAWRDTTFFRDFILHYINTFDQVNSEFIQYADKLDMAKSILYTKCRSFISGLHVLADNKVPEAILHGNTFGHMLQTISDDLHKTTYYSLLHGTIVNPYFHMKIARSFIINNALYMNIMLPLMDMRLPLMRLYGLQSHYMPTNMSDVSNSYKDFTKLVVTYPYIAYNSQYYMLLADDYEDDTVTFDTLHVPSSPILLHDRNQKNCILGIIEHAPVKDIMDMCKFDYYRNITVVPSLVTTPDHYYLMNIGSRISIKCGSDRIPHIQTSFPVTIVSRVILCGCILRTSVFILLGTETNCTDNPILKLSYTFNFVTEWIADKLAIPFYQENLHLLRFPSTHGIRPLPLTSSSHDHVYTNNNVPAIRLERLVEMMSKLDKDLFLSMADQNKYDRMRADNRTKQITSDILDVDSWFNSDMNFTMIFMFIASLISIVGLIFLIYMCYKNSKIAYGLSYLLGKSTIAEATKCSGDTRHYGYDYLYVHIAFALIMVLIGYACLKAVMKLYRYYRVYNTVLFFKRDHGISLSRITSICLEFSNFQDSIVVHIGNMNTPIGLISAMNCLEFPRFRILNVSCISAKLTMDCPIFLRHLDCPDLIPSATSIELGWWQTFKLRRLFKGDYLIRVIAYQNNILIPLSKLNSSTRIVLSRQLNLLNQFNTSVTLTSDDIGRHLSGDAHEMSTSSLPSAPAMIDDLVRAELGNTETCEVDTSLNTSPPKPMRVRDAIQTTGHVTNEAKPLDNEGIPRKQPYLYPLLY